MPSKWKFPRTGQSWSECSWCGQEYPSPLVWLNPRFGWQCYKCWDGLVQRDQILQPIFPYEGTRRTPAPLVPPLEGTGGSLGPSYTYILRDRVTGTIYNVTITPFGIQNGNIVYWTTDLPTIVQTTPSSDDLIWDGIRTTGGWDVYVANGILASEYQPGPTTLEIVDGICDFGSGSSGSFLLYDRAYPSDVWTLVFSDVITVTEASGPAAAGILLNDGWNFFIQGDGTPGGGLARFDQVPYSGDILWDNSHTFFVDTTGVEPILRYAP